MKVVSLFAGVGGVDKGFELAGCQTIWANEFDPRSAEIFRANFPNTTLDTRDIQQVPSGQIPQMDILTAGFPCQAFSIEGRRAGFEDERGNLFLEVARIAERHRPKVIFCENVKHLVSHDGGRTFEVILSVFGQLGYKVKWKVLKTSDYSRLPQLRERVYLVAFLDQAAADRFQFPRPVEVTGSLRDFIGFGQKVADKYYYRTGSAKYGVLSEHVTSQGHVYTIRRSQKVRVSRAGHVPTLLASMGTGGNNVPILLDDFGEIRKLTPRECFNLQGFGRDFVLPPTVADSGLYKACGNSVSVPVIESLARQVLAALS